ncbi:MAG: hypothetical protein JXR95_11990 [Deltaproteobacteria bacterium]|nr:hypothetical protein [Deltaproteobacteria bacterium]
MKNFPNGFEYLRQSIKDSLEELKNGFRTGSALEMKLWRKVYYSTDLVTREDKIKIFLDRYDKFAWNSWFYLEIGKKQLASDRISDGIYSLLKAYDYQNAHSSEAAMKLAIDAAVLFNRWKSLGIIKEHMEQQEFSEAQLQHFEKAKNSLMKVQFIYISLTVVLLLTIALGLYPLRCGRRYWILVFAVPAYFMKEFIPQLILIGNILFYSSWFFYMFSGILNDKRFKVSLWIFLPVILIQSMILVGIIPLGYWFI